MTRLWHALLTITVVLVLTPATPAPAATGCDVRISAPADLQARYNQAGPGKTICQSGTFNTKTGNIYPAHGQTIIGGTLRYTGSYNVNWAEQKAHRMVDGYNLIAGNITLDNVTVLDFEGRGVVCGPHSVIQNSTLNNNHRNAVSCWADGAEWWVRISNNTMIHDGDSALERHSSGGVKLISMAKPNSPLGAGGIVENNYIVDSEGNGIWWDQTSNAGIARGNTANHSTHSGIRIEISGGPFLVANNETRNNNWDGIGVRNSAYVTLRGNDSTGNDRDINVSYGARDVLNFPAYRQGVGYHPYRIVVEDTRLATGKVLGCGIPKVQCSR